MTADTMTTTSEFLSPNGAIAKGRWDCPKCGEEIFYAPDRRCFECEVCGPVRSLGEVGVLLGTELQKLGVGYGYRVRDIWPTMAEGA